MTTKFFLLSTLFLFSCKSLTTKTDNNSTAQVAQQDSVSPTKTNKKANDIEVLQTHLKDTIIIKGNFVLFLRPDSTRFESYAKEDENIYEADSDFGFGISATMDSISGNKKYKDLHTAVSDKRYIVIEGCKNCPHTIDRDTINYGLLLTSKGKKIKVTTNLHSGDYLQDVDEYFNIINDR